MKDEAIAAEAVAMASAAAASAVDDTAMWLDPGCAWTWALARNWDRAATAEAAGSGGEKEGDRAR